MNKTMDIIKQKSTFQYHVNGDNTILDKNENLDSYKNAFNGYIRYGNETKLEELEQKNAQIKTEGGYSVTLEMQKQIHDNLIALNPLRQLASVTQISGDTLEVLDEKTKITAGWGDVGLREAEKGNQLEFNKLVIPAHELYAQAKTTQKLLDDPHVNVEEWLSNALVEAFHKKESDAFFNGNGENKPKGLLNISKDTTQNNIETKELSVENLISLFYKLPDHYARDAKFLMHRSTAEKVMMLKDESGRYLWQQSIAEKCSGRLFGLEVIISPDMSPYGEGNTIIVLSDIKRAYQIVDRDTIRVLRDPFTEKPLVKFYAYKRVGGGVILSDAVRFLTLKK